MRVPVSISFELHAWVMTSAVSFTVRSMYGGYSETQAEAPRARDSFLDVAQVVAARLRQSIAYTSTILKAFIPHPHTRAVAAACCGWSVEAFDESYPQ